MPPVPQDYLHRVYAGVLGKLIGVYLGRPFENWTYQQILEKLGPIEYYVHDKFNLPCVVIDDDVSGTFAFVRALEEHGTDLSSLEIGKTWLNNVIEKRNVFWWGGNGISTEHTVYLNLKRGIPAPDSGSIQTNGRTVAEQIGAQIFIDGWAMVAPGNPKLAARLAEAAARVSHDGEAAYAAILWAVMEAEAFVSKDIDHLIDTGLSFIPNDSAIAKLIADVRAWVKEDNDWQRTRQRIENHYGYDKYSGICHVIPNHGIMIMALLYAGHDFDRAMMIINTSGWDTDCNSGNVGCLVGIILGLDAFGGPEYNGLWPHKDSNKHDWRGPVADRAIISSADSGYSINNATSIAYDLANTGLNLAGQPPFPVPDAQFHFSLPGSLQGFQLRGNSSNHAQLWWNQVDNRSGLVTVISNLAQTTPSIELSTDTFTPTELLHVSRHYDLSASPLVYPGQTLTAKISSATSSDPLTVCLRLKAYNHDDTLLTLDSDPTLLHPSATAELTFLIPASLQNKPIQQVGIAISPPPTSTSTKQGTIWLHTLGWSGTPRLTLRRPTPPSDNGDEDIDPGGTEHNGTTSMWARSFVSSVDKFHSTMGPSFFLAQDRGEGMVMCGTREWGDYRVRVREFVVNLGRGMVGVVVRCRGLRRWYGVLFVDGGGGGGRVVILKARDEERVELASATLRWGLDQKYEVEVRVTGGRIWARVGGVELSAEDGEYKSGGIGLVVTEGSVAAESIDVGPVGEW